MAVKELRIVEERCDRCELLISKKQLGSDNEVVSSKKQAENTGPFKLVEVGASEQDADSVLVDYEVVCDRCRTLLVGLVLKMGKVNRGTRNRPKKKKTEKKEDKKSATKKK